MRILLLFLLFPILSAAHSVSDEAPVDTPAITFSNTPGEAIETRAIDDLVSALKGYVTSIPVLDNDSPGHLPPAELSVRITGHPVEGIVSVHPETNEVTYRHGGASILNDTFTYVLEHKGAVVSGIATVTVSFREIRAEVKITSPADNSVVTGDTVVVHYEIAGTDFDHLHVNLNGKHNTVHSPDGTYILENVPPGSHSISVNLANERHQVIRAAGATDSVTVRVMAE